MFEGGPAGGCKQQGEGEKRGGERGDFYGGEEDGRLDGEGDGDGLEEAGVGGREAVETR